MDKINEEKVLWSPSKNRRKNTNQIPSNSLLVNDDVKSKKSRVNKEDSNLIGSQRKSVPSDLEFSPEVASLMGITVETIGEPSSVNQGREEVRTDVKECSKSASITGNKSNALVTGNEILVSTNVNDESTNKASVVSSTVDSENPKLAKQTTISDKNAFLPVKKTPNTDPLWTYTGSSFVPPDRGST
eukprot:CAMPEP_0119043688 /NCGR_PEP_ID=MMETSP1177-20130426/24928_1 /TAXON_ID=2985 /ORGANISM="Ochromonas sp, Strain CCMP1899" /LENGTH=186 /DNA_ID=CAMNT_0007012365 /DNA_START=176 /DNA_END=732 /DNA_ORIENTATION=+